MNPNQEGEPLETTSTQKAKWRQVVKRPPVLGTLIGLLASPLLVYLATLWKQLVIVVFPLALIPWMIPFGNEMTERMLGKMLDILDFAAAPYLLVVLQCSLYGWFIGRCLGRKHYRRLVLVGLLVHVLPMIGAFIWLYT